MTANKTYQKIVEYGIEEKSLHSILVLIEWDQETYMPKGSLPSRIRQLELLSSIHHKHKTSAKWTKLLGSGIDLDKGTIHLKNLHPRQEQALTLWRKDFLKDHKLPTSFVKKLTSTTAEASAVWAEARKEDNFKKFLPHLEKVFDLQKKKADYLGYDEHPYDALIDLYEPECTAKELTKLFSKLKPFLSDLTKKKQAKTEEPSWMSKSLDPSKLSKFYQTVLHGMGLDPNYSRLDYSAHPFCQGIDPTDVRITTHDHGPFISGISAVMHEAGHALYERNLPIQDFGTPLCEPTSLGIHESQSRFWETMIGLGKPFWQHYFPVLKNLFPQELNSLTLDEFYQGITRIEPSLIRIFADEVTYILHVILRFEIEKGLLEGSYKPKDLPEIWNAKMQELLGITPPNFKEGCMQDIHWSLGLVGYFPTYALGNLYAAQIFAHMKQIFPSWKEKIASGDLLFMHEWLKKHIHSEGRMLSPIDLVAKATNKPFSEQDYLKYLESKYC